MKKSNRLSLYILLAYLAILVMLMIDFLLQKKFDFLAFLVLLISAVLTFCSSLYFSHYHRDVADSIENSLSGSMSDALKEGDIGILVYNEDYEITWLSGLFQKREINSLGEKLLLWLPELKELLSGKSDRCTVILNDIKFSVTKKEDAFVLYFKDITKEYDLEKKNEESAYVLGLVNFDNYDELSLSEDEVAFVDTNIKVPVLEYFRSYGVVYKTLRNDRLQLIMNYSAYQCLLEDRFSILNKVRREAKAKDSDVTLSISLAYGSDSLSDLDEIASSLLEIAQTRGGDQIAVRKAGEEAVFYGGSSEAKERQSRVKVRVVASTLRRLVNKASNVVIVGHKDADADCVGASLAMSCIVSAFGKEAYIVLNSGGVEPMIKETLSRYEEALEPRHVFVSENEAEEVMDDDTLVLMLDHHSKVTSNGQNILEKARNIVIIDHHRRKADLDVTVSFLYVEAGASSTSEMCVELFQYISRNFTITKEEANILYIGLLIDTNHFRTRSDSRTFDVAKILKQYGADSAECENLISEPYDMSKKRFEIIAAAKRIKDNIVIADMKNGTYPRSIASQAVDRLIEIREIDAAFVLWKLSSGETAISARSNGKINVQAIMEKLGGGGHLSAAGLQTKEIRQDDLYDQLIKEIDKYLEREKEDESNIVE